MAAARLRSGAVKQGLCVNGLLEVPTDVERLPDYLWTHTLDVSRAHRLRSLPPFLHVRDRLVLRNHPHPEELLTRGVTCRGLDLTGSPIVHLPDRVKVRDVLNMDGCTRLETLPTGLRVEALHLRGCVALRALPDGMEVMELDISGCTGIERWPACDH